MERRVSRGVAAAVLAVACASAGCGESFQLRLVPFVASNQLPFDQATAYDLYLEHSDGAVESYEQLKASGSEVTLEGASTLEDTRILVTVRGDNGIQAVGQTGPLSQDDGEKEVGVLVTSTQAVAFLDSMEDGLFLAPLNALEDGRFLMTGGLYMRGIGNSGDGEPKSAAQILNLGEVDPEDGPQFEWLADLPDYEVAGATFSGRHGHSATLLTQPSSLAGKVLVAGGASRLMESPAVTDDAFLLDPVTGEISRPTESSTMRTPRYEHIAVANDVGDVVILGGWTYHPDDRTYSATDQIEIFSAEEQKFKRPVPPDSVISSPYGAAAAVPTRGVFHCGGSSLTSSSEWIPTSACILVKQDRSVQEMPSLLAPLAHASMTALSSTKVLLTGGISATDPLDSYTPQAADNDAWTYDFETSQWEFVGNMNVARNRHETVLLPDGRVLIVGGRESGTLVQFHTEDDFIDCIEIFDPEGGLDGTSPFTLLDGCRSSNGSGQALQNPVAQPMVAMDSAFGVMISGGLTSNGSSASMNLWVPQR